MISMEKTYRTKNGRAVRILCVDRKDERFPVIALVESSDGKREELFNYRKEGRSHTYNNCDGSPLDLVEFSHYDDFKMDDKVVVSNGSAEHRRHFAGVNECGKPLTWNRGQTSFTTECSKAELIPWKYCYKI